MKTTDNDRKYFLIFFDFFLFEEEPLKKRNRDGDFANCKFYLTANSYRYAIC